MSAEAVYFERIGSSKFQFQAPSIPRSLLSTSQDTQHLISVIVGSYCICNSRFYSNYLFLPFVVFHKHVHLTLGATFAAIYPAFFHLTRRLPDRCIASDLSRCLNAILISPQTTALLHTSRPYAFIVPKERAAYIIRCTYFNIAWDSLVITIAGYPNSRRR